MPIRKHHRHRPVWVRWVERGTALVAVVNLLVVAFDLSYVRWRDFYFRHSSGFQIGPIAFPKLTKAYDWIKGIEPHRDTEAYLTTADALLQELESASSPAIGVLLPKLQRSSQDIRAHLVEAEQNQPALEEEQKQLDTRVEDWLQKDLPDEAAGEADTEASTETPAEASGVPGFDRLWTRETIARKGWLETFKFFNTSIAPLLEELAAREEVDARIVSAYTDAVVLLREQVAEAWLDSLSGSSRLASLRSRSSSIVDENPFAIANKSGTLERIKNRMRDRVDLPESSAKQAFETFWSKKYLTEGDWAAEIDFFDRDIRPLFASNYFRKIDETGGFVDLFWLVDFPFVLFFATEMLARASILAFLAWRRGELEQKDQRWQWLANLIVDRWYDIFLLLPFLRWLRVIPVVVRLHQAEIFDLYPVRDRLSQGIIANFAAELTEVVVIRVVNRMQEAVQQGEISSWLLDSDRQSREYIDINNVNEIEAIANHLTQLFVYNVFPKVETDLAALIHHSLDNAMHNLAVYQGLRQVPGFETIPKQLTENLSIQVVRALQDTLKGAIEDPVGAQLFTKLAENIMDSLRSEVSQRRTVEEIQSLLYDFLEEMKINYVVRSYQEDPEAALLEAQQVYKKIQK